MGKPQPIHACIPRREDRSKDPVAVRDANRTASFVGKWIIKSPDAAANEERREISDNDIVYLEQDFVFLSGALHPDQDQQCQLRSIGSGEDEAHPEVDRRGLWRIRISAHLQDSGGKKVRKKERVLERASENLTWSNERRTGNKRQYLSTGQGMPILTGEQFARTIRAHITEAADRTEEEDLSRHVSKERSPHAYYKARFDDVGPRDPKKKSTVVSAMMDYTDAITIGSPLSHSSSWSYFPAYDESGRMEVEGRAMPHSHCSHMHTHMSGSGPQRKNIRRTSSSGGPKTPGSAMSQQTTTTFANESIKSTHRHLPAVQMRK
eukprot:CAMPEP_0118871062 /NCGR_PEP_ID=MMETSP1163-20130328/13787_1 /TAXON_ID=124430 /ORGANISM="Phaeomonas parva, Strain CCMP2877" /LENGTH=320 /DNA_ID=CAMNT_0006806127 /DNA_START=45 /DNA_END=1004 /DNA_ORIENTATION=-